MWFKEDLADGKEFEHQMLEIASQEFPSEKWELNTEIKWVDIISSSWKTIEVKYDKMGATTWNIFIEVECNGKPSWINAYQDIDIFTSWIWENIYMWNAERLKLALKGYPFRKLKWGDWWRVSGYLIPISIGKIIASKILRQWQQQTTKEQ